MRVPATRIPSRVAAPGRAKLIAVPCRKKTPSQCAPSGTQAPSSRFSVGVGCALTSAAAPRPAHATIHARSLVFHSIWCRHLSASRARWSACGSPPLVSGEHEGLDRKHQRLNTQVHRMHDLDGTHSMKNHLLDRADVV